MDRAAHEHHAYGFARLKESSKLVGRESVEPAPQPDVGILRPLRLHAHKALDHAERWCPRSFEHALARKEGAVERVHGDRCGVVQGRTSMWRRRKEPSLASRPKGRAPREVPASDLAADPTVQPLRGDDGPLGHVERDVAHAWGGSEFFLDDVRLREGPDPAGQERARRIVRDDPVCVRDTKAVERVGPFECEVAL